MKSAIYVGTVVKNITELQQIYEILVNAGYSERHSQSPKHLANLVGLFPNGDCAVAVDADRDILGVFRFGEDVGDVVVTADVLASVAQSIFPV